MTKLFTRASVTGASLSGANLKAVLTALWDALNTVGVTDSNRTTITASATLLTSQCGYLLVDCSGGSVTLTLPTSGTASDEAEYKIRRIDSSGANTLTVQRGGSDTVEGATASISVGIQSEIGLKLPAGASNWRVTGRGGAISTRAYTVPCSVAFSATPTFDVSLSNVFYLGALTANVTSFTMSNPADGQTVNIRFVQDATGGRTVALPASVHATGGPQPGANLASWLCVTYVASASRWEGSWVSVP